MIKLTQTGPGAVTHASMVRDTNGKGLLPVQVSVSGAADYRVSGRIAPDLPWIELWPERSAPTLESTSWVPFLQLEVTSGTGTATLWLGEE